MLCERGFSIAGCIKPFITRQIVSVRLISSVNFPLINMYSHSQYRCMCNCKFIVHLSINYAGSSHLLSIVGSELPRTLNVKMPVVWNVTPCTLIDIYLEVRSRLSCMLVHFYQTPRSYTLKDSNLYHNSSICLCSSFLSFFICLSFVVGYEKCIETFNPETRKNETT
jgi:hypothetical protein